MGELLAFASRHGPTSLAFAIAFVGFLRFARWGTEFACERLDVSRGNLGQRLKHVEQELDATREALFLMLNRMAEKYPTDPVLQDVAVILRKAWPIWRDPDGDLLSKLHNTGGSNVAAA